MRGPRVLLSLSVNLQSAERLKKKVCDKLQVWSHIPKAKEHKGERCYIRLYARTYYHRDYPQRKFKALSFINAIREEILDQTLEDPFTSYL